MHHRDEHITVRDLFFSQQMDYGYCMFKQKKIWFTDTLTAFSCLSFPQKDCQRGQLFRFI